MSLFCFWIQENQTHPRIKQSCFKQVAFTAPCGPVWREPDQDEKTAEYTRFMDFRRFFSPEHPCWPPASIIHCIWTVAAGCENPLLIGPNTCIAYAWLTALKCSPDENHFRTGPLHLMYLHGCILTFFFCHISILICNALIHTHT